jgi:hypothetical protein
MVVALVMAVLFLGAVSPWIRNGEATMAAKRERLPTTKELLILAIVAVVITAITVGASNWDKWFSSNDPRILITPAH